MTKLLISVKIGITTRKRKSPLSLNKLKSLNRLKDFLDRKIQEIDTELTENNNGQFKQKSLLLQRKILQSFKTSTLHNLEMLEKGDNRGFN